MAKIRLGQLHDRIGPRAAMSTTAAVLRSLPAPLTPLIGREWEMAEVAGLLRSARLVTLTGPGGVGKTRLAIAVAAEIADTIPHGVWFVSLATISDSRLVVPALSHALGLRESGAESLATRLAGYLRDKTSLLVLDNFEQVIEAAPVVAELLAAAPHLTILVTSRTRLRLSGEHEYPVPPLSVPYDVSSATTELLIESAAIRLFSERAQAVQPAFALTAENAPVVAGICYRVDGLPLAIELAAPRVKVLPPPVLLARLDRRLSLLTGGGRDVPARQRTMRDTIAWSFNLLPEPEQRLFQQLAVFVGGFALEAAEQVAGDTTGIDLLDGIAALVDASLLRQAIGHEGEPRFLMLETVREYGLERLVVSGDMERMRQRHAEYYLALAERTDPALRGREHGRWLARLGMEDANLRAALTWLAETGHTFLCLQLAGSLAHYWHYRGLLSEGRAWLERSLALDPDGAAPPELRAEVISGLGYLAFYLGSYEQAEAYMTDAAVLWGRTGDEHSQARCLELLGGIAEYSGDEQRAIALYRQALAYYQELGDRARIGETLVNLADAAYRRDDLGEAETLASDAVAACEAAGDVIGRAFASVGLAQALLARGDRARASGLLGEALADYHAEGYGLGLVDALAGCAAVANATGQPERAAWLLGAATALRVATGAARPMHFALYQQTLDAVRGAAGEEAFAGAWSAGSAADLETAIAEASQTISAQPVSAAPATAEDQSDGPRLTPREREVLRLLVAGLSDRESGETLSISPRTVERHITNILGKLDLPSRTALVAYAVRHHLA